MDEMHEFSAVLHRREEMKPSGAALRTIGRERDDERDERDELLGNGGETHASDLSCLSGRHPRVHAHLPSRKSALS
jgi:hypothetical protein